MRRGSGIVWCCAMAVSAGCGGREADSVVVAATHQAPGEPGAEEEVGGTVRTLLALQSPDGSWESGDRRHDVGVTGLALLAFLGKGYTHRGEGAVPAAVLRGLRYLRAHQVPSGRFLRDTDDPSLFDHAVAALAMTAAFNMTESLLWKASAQKAIAFISAARVAGGAWQESGAPGDADDASVSVWMGLPLICARLIDRGAEKSGKERPFRVDEGAVREVREWMEARADPQTGRVEARSPPNAPGGLSTGALTAACVYLRMLLSEDAAGSETSRAGVAALTAAPPSSSPAANGVDLAYWYFGSLATGRAGGAARRTWRAALFDSLRLFSHREMEPRLDPTSWISTAGRSAVAALVSLSTPPLCEVYGYGGR